MKTKFKIVFLLTGLLLSTLSKASIYIHDFGTTTISAYPYTVTPPTFDANLNSSSWTNSVGVWTSFAGSTGQAIALSNSSGTPTFTLTFNVASGYALTVSSFNFWCQRSAQGARSWSLSINGTTVGSGTNTIPTSGTNIGLTTVSGVSGLTGTITIVLSLSGAIGTGTFRLDDFTLNGSVNNLSITNAGDIFRSKTTVGNWNSASTWESSGDNGTTWINSTLIPDANAQSITIQNGHTITIDAAASAGKLYVSSGGILVHTAGIAFTITNGNPLGYDFTVDGTYVINGKQPTFSSSNCLINGTVRVDDNIGGESDQFATVPDVIFATGAIYEWHTTKIFGTANARYFRYSGSNIPIFKITQNVSNVGSNSFTYFLGKFEVEAGKTIKFIGKGTKYFRDGIGGDGTIVHDLVSTGGNVNCGTFNMGDNLTNTNPVIDGTIKITINGLISNSPDDGSPYNTADFLIDPYATVTIQGSPTITVGTSGSTSPYNGALMTVSGTLINNSTNPIDLTYGRLSIIGSGVLNSSSTGTFKCSNNFTRITSAGTVANSSTGVLKLATNFNTVYRFIMGDPSSPGSTSSRIILGTDVNVDSSINLYQGILVSDYHLLTWNNTKGSITLPTTYTSSFIATCDQNGNALIAPGLSATTTTPFDGSVGFRINNVKGTSYTMFPIGSNFSRPNKIAINPNNNITATNITVVVGHGDILYTPFARVNRIWYVHTSDQTADSAINMQLYFTKYQWSTNNFGVGQDEIEDGFDPTSVYVGRRDYSTDPHLTHRSVLNNVSPLGTSETFAEYKSSASPHLPGYYKFSVGNFGTIILPVSIINVKAYKSGNNINVEWSALHELNIDHYEVEHSSNGIAFAAIANTSATNNGGQQNNYTSTDAHPLNGNNFYRIKAIDKDGQVKYSSIVSVNMNSNYVGIKVLPNPVNNRLMNIQLSNLPAGKYDLLLYSANGQRVFTTNFTFNGGFSSQVVVLPPNIRTGAYILKLFNGTNKFTQNIMVE